MEYYEPLLCNPFRRSTTASDISNTLFGESFSTRTVRGIELFPPIILISTSRKIFSHTVLCVVKSNKTTSSDFFFAIQMSYAYNMRLSILTLYFHISPPACATNKFPRKTHILN